MPRPRFFITSFYGMTYGKCFQGERMTTSGRPLGQAFKFLGRLAFLRYGFILTPSPPCLLLIWIRPAIARAFLFWLTEREVVPGAAISAGQKAQEPRAIIQIAYAAPTELASTTCVWRSGRSPLGSPDLKEIVTVSCKSTEPQASSSRSPTSERPPFIARRRGSPLPARHLGMCR